MRCAACGTDAPSGARFCPACGGRLSAGCAQCGAALPPDARFCPACGAAQAAQAPAAPAPAPAPASGENRVATVLFADMAGSVRATGALAAEDAAALVNRLLEAMVEAVRRYGGRVDRFLGDGVLAVFGVPHAHEDDPERALHAAVDIRDAATRLGFAASVGVNTGEVYFGGVGSEGHRETTVMGAAVNLAARLQAAAGGGRVLAGETTRRLAQGAFETRPLDVHVKGFDEAVRAWEVLRATERRGKVRGDGTRSPLVGRDEELARLRRAMELALAGRGQVVTLSGEAGVGKSRLLAELRAAARERPDVLWLEGRCSEMSSAESYAPFVDVLRERVGWAPGADERVLAERLQRGLRSLVARGALAEEAADDAAPLLAELLSIHLGEPWDARVRGASPDQLRARTFVALREWLLALARASPLVLVLEDLHWSDELSLALVPELMEAAAAAPVLLLCAHRPEPAHGSARLATLAAQKAPGHHVDVRLAELAPEDGRRLVRSLLGDAAPADVDELVLARAQGNPLFVEEIVRSLREAGVAGRVGAQGEAVPLRVPESLQSVVLARVDTLDADARHLLQCASVFGRLFRPRLVQHLLPAPTDVHRALRVLEERGLVYPERFVPEEEWSFKHALVQETVYGSLLKARRAELHEAAGRALERATPDEARDQHYAELARHFELGRDAAKAVEYHLKAGDKARRAYLNDAAAAHYRRVLERTADAPTAPERLSAQEGLAAVLAHTGRHAEALTYLDAALAALPATGLARARLHRMRANALLHARRYDDLRAEFARAHEALGPQGWRASPEAAREWIETATDLCWALYWTTGWQEIEGVLAQATPVVDAHATDAQRARFYFSVVLFELRRDRFVVSERALRVYVDTFEAGVRSGEPFLVTLVHFARGVGLVWAADLDAGERFLTKALELGRRIGDSLNVVRSTVYLGYVWRQRGDVEEATRWALEGVRVTPPAMHEYVGVNEANLAWIAWKNGRLDEARERAERAAECFRNPIPAYPFRWLAHTLLVRLALDEGDAASAARWVRPMLEPTQQRLPDDLTSLLAEGAYAAEAGRAKEALDLFERALARHVELRHL